MKGGHLGHCRIDPLFPANNAQYIKCFPHPSSLTILSRVIWGKNKLNLCTHHYDPEQKSSQTGNLTQQLQYREKEEKKFKFVYTYHGNIRQHNFMFFGMMEILVFLSVQHAIFVLVAVSPFLLIVHNVFFQI